MTATDRDLPRVRSVLIGHEFSRAVAGRLFADATAADATEVSEVFAACLDEIAERMARQERVELRGFGVFEARQTRPTVKTKPGTLERVEVPAKLRPVFRATKPLKTRINVLHGGAE